MLVMFWCIFKIDIFPQKYTKKKFYRLRKDSKFILLMVWQHGFNKHFKKIYEKLLKLILT